MRRLSLMLLSGALSLACHRVPLGELPAASVSLPLVEANENTRAAGTFRDGVLMVELDAVRAGWRPDLNVDSAVTVFAFAERGGQPQIPGPLIRAPQGSEVRIIVRNQLADQPLLFFGRTLLTAVGDTIPVPPGAAHEFRFLAADAGTFLYRAQTPGPTPDPGFARRDALLTGALIVDPPGVAIDPAERVFVLTLIDIWADSASGHTEDIWELAINGRSWPHTERLRYAVGDTVRWRWVNATDRIHPMHLHGFHFRVLAKGDGRSDTTYSPHATRLGVTEAMLAGTTFAMEWIPTRAGNWLMHCHMVPHITPFPERADSIRSHDVHQPARHPEEAMAGLVLGITTVGERDGDPALWRGGTHHRLFVQERNGDSITAVRRGYVLQRRSEPARDSVEIPGSPLVVTRGQTATITILNRLSQPTSIHWHGMELESVFDGVPGYSGIGSSRSPLLAPGDSFTVSFTPPRAGTYMYHTHMDEEEQLVAGLYAPLVVLEPGVEYDSARDILLTVGSLLSVRGEPEFALNGRTDPHPVPVVAGVPHRLRLINLLWASPVRVAFMSGDAVIEWRWVSKDGADLPPALTQPRPARIVRIGVGEAYDFEWTPREGEQPVLVLEKIEAGGVAAHTIRQAFDVQERR
jgi:manganese oxidase